MTDGQELIRDLAAEQRKRLVASILGQAERTFKQKLTPREWADFRDKVMDSIGTYHDFLLDVIKVSRDGMIRNEEAIRIIEQIHASQVRMERHLTERVS